MAATLISRRLILTEDISEEINGKPWRCANGHLLGHVHRNQNDIRYLFMVAVVESGMLMLRITGQAEIVCPECGEARTWFPGDEAIQELIERSTKMKKAIVDSREDSC